jgi:hypothetical protein
VSVCAAQNGSSSPQYGSSWDTRGSNRDNGSVYDSGRNRPYTGTEALESGRLGPYGNGSVGAYGNGAVGAYGDPGRGARGGVCFGVNC